MSDASVKSRGQQDEETGQERSPDQVAAFRLAAILLVVNVFLVLILGLVFRYERIPLLNIVVSLAVARHLYKLRRGTEVFALGLAALSSIVAPLLFFWNMGMVEALTESIALWGVTGPLFLLLLGSPNRRRRLAAVAVFCAFRVGIYTLAVVVHFLSS